LSKFSSGKFQLTTEEVGRKILKEMRTGRRPTGNRPTSEVGSNARDMNLWIYGSRPPNQVIPFDPKFLETVGKNLPNGLRKLAGFVTSKRKPSSKNHIFDEMLIRNRQENAEILEMEIST
jgi:hypothetical protein